jgi:DHA1 family bicyclomycin/chloramphenicol resistance-like MFS transporter
MLFAGWRWIFGIMAAMAAVLLVWSGLRMQETLRPEFRQPVNFGAIAGNMATVLTTRESIGYILGMSATSAMFFTFLSSSQQLIGEKYGAGQAFPFIFAAMASTMAVANFSNSRIVMRFGTRRVSHAGLFVYLAIGVCQVAFAFGGGESLWQFSVLMAATMCVMGFVTANFGAIALQPFARTAGAAASVMTFLRMVIGSASGALVGLAYDGTTRPLAATMLLGALITLALVLFSERGRLFRRINPPASTSG